VSADPAGAGLGARLADWLLGTGPVAAEPAKPAGADPAGPRASFDLASLQGERLAEFLRVGGGAETGTGLYVGDSTAMKVAVFWRSVQIISGAVANVPTDLVMRVSEKERRPAVGHPLRRVLTAKPNQWQTPHEFKRLMQLYLLLRGNAYALKVTAGRDVVALIPMRPDRVLAEQLDNGKMRYRYTRANGAQEILAQEQVMHLRGMSFDGVTGLSPLSFMRESLGLSVAGEQASAKVMKNGQFTPGYVSHPDTLGEEGLKNLRESLDVYFRGIDNAGKWLLLEEGMQAGKLSLSAADMEFIKLREFQRYDVAMFMGVPPPLLGIPNTTSNFGTGVEQQGIGFHNYTLNDWFRVWEEAIKRDLIPEAEWETHDFRFYAQGMLRGDVKTRWETYVKGMQWGVMSPNEVRALEDINPRDGGDVYYDPPNTAGTRQGEQMGDPGARNEGEQNEPA
jgi:HK97 family phage portal protein